MARCYHEKFEPGIAAGVATTAKCRSDTQVLAVKFTCPQ
jgi:hypothetical protein